MSKLSKMIFAQTAPIIAPICGKVITNKPETAEWAQIANICKFFNWV